MIIVNKDYNLIDTHCIKHEIDPLSDDYIIYAECVHGVIKNLITCIDEEEAIAIMEEIISKAATDIIIRVDKIAKEWGK